VPPASNHHLCYDTRDHCLDKANLTERRVLSDRRKQTLWAHINANPNYLRRCQIRRSSDFRSSYLDRYRPKLVYLTIAILLLSCLDATFTLNLLQRGSVELNPIMAWLIAVNPHLFVAVKLGFTAMGSILLLAHTHFLVFRSLRVVNLLYLCLFGYFALICYEIMLFGWVF